MSGSLAGVIVCVGLAAVPDGGAVSSRFRFDVPGALDEADVPGMLQANGLPLKLRAVRTKLGVAALTAHFTAAFTAAGLYLPPEEHLTAPGPHVTGLDTKTRISYTALFQQNADGTVTVLLSEVFVHAKKDAEAFVPLFPGASEPVDAQSEGTRSLQFTAPAPAKEIESFYRDVFSKAGCRESEPLVFRCAEKQNRLWVRERKGQPTSVSVQQTGAKGP